MKEMEELKQELAKIESKKDELKRTFLRMSDLLFDTDKVFDDILSESPNMLDLRDIDFTPSAARNNRENRTRKHLDPSASIETLDEMIRSFTQINRSPRATAGVSNRN